MSQISNKIKSLVKKLQTEISKVQIKRSPSFIAYLITTQTNRSFDHIPLN